MPEHFYKEKLYPLQDIVLEIISSCKTNFYLTGGTALSRHYLHHRYSDDLDLFVNNSASFKVDTEKIFNALKKQFEGLSVSISDDMYVRLFIIRGDTSLKVEFVNDVDFHTNGFESSHWFHKIDSWPLAYGKI